MDNITIVIPFWNGHAHITRLLDSLPVDLPVLVVDDHSDQPLTLDRKNTRVIRYEEKGYFTGAVNAGMGACRTDVLILNQDVHFDEGTRWLDLLAEKRETFGLIGEGIAGNHPAWPEGYIHGTFMYIRRDVIDALGPMDAENYPLWGSTCEYQLRACRKGFRTLVIPQGQVPGFHHHRRGGRGDSIQELLRRQPRKRGLFIRTPPLISVIVPSYNHGRYLESAINSLISGSTDLGDMPGQTLQSFEVIIVDDGSTDDTPRIGRRLADARKGIHYVRHEKNRGTPAANNTGLRRARGKYFTILCGDDMYESERLQTLYRAAQQYPDHVIYDDMMEFGYGERRRVWPMRGYNFDKLIYKNAMHCGIFLPRAAWQEVGGYPEIMRHGREDWAMNVALGVAGWCGVRVTEPGYLYRRENQNRTLTNTNRQWREYFLGQLQSLFPHIYAGERPDMCCGNKGKTMNKPKAKARAISNPQGGVLLEYIGRSVGDMTWFGASGKRYRAGGVTRIFPVDEEDVKTLLGMTEGHQKIFQRYATRVAPEPVKVKEKPKPARKAPPVKPIPLPDPSLLTVSEIRQLLDDTSYSGEQIAAILEAERGGKGRKTAIEALENALV